MNKFQALHSFLSESPNNEVSYSRVSHGKIVSVNNVTKKITVRNDKGEQWLISSDIFNNEFDISTLFSEEKKVTQTEILSIFNQSINKAITVGFHKLPRHDDNLISNEELRELYPNKGIGKIPTTKNAFVVEMQELISKKLKERNQKGEYRKYSGEWTGKLTQQNHFIFNARYDNKINIKTIVPRNIVLLIVDGIKYYV